MGKIGVDFGTTNSLMVLFDKTEEQPSFSYFNLKGHRPAPTSSTVWYHDNEIVVGDEARNSISRFGDIEGHHFERSIKLKLGSGKNIDILGEIVQPYKVAGTILSYLKKQATEKWKANELQADFDRAVFTVPINFSGEARRDLRKSAHDAGMDVITFIHEPFAAVIGHYFTRKEDTSLVEIMNDLRQLEGKNILVFDWGGGTLDITVVKATGNRMIELGTAEMTNVAGDKFDEQIATYAWNTFVDILGAKYSNDYLETIRKAKWSRILAGAEKTKIALSQADSAKLFIPNITGFDENIDIEFTRDIFEEIICDALDAAMNCVDAALSEAGLQDINVAQVLLTGGSCYIPAIQRRLTERFGFRSELVKNADLVIAQGAAVIAEMGWLPFLSKDTQIMLSDGSFWPIFEKGMPIATSAPAVNEETFICVDQRSKRAKVIICEGDGQKKDKVLATLNVPVLADNRFGDEIVVHAEIDKDIVMNVKAHSKMVHGYENSENYSIRKSVDIHKLCFGLDFSGVG